MCVACEFGSRVSSSIFGLMFMGSVILSICSSKLCDVFCWVWCEKSACCPVCVEDEVVFSESMYVDVMVYVFHVGMIGCLL